MLKLIKYLRKSIVPIIAIVILLIFQAMCDLQLPDYTSVIVNVGIQQSGIEDAVPVAVRESTLQSLEMFMTQEHASLVQDSYTLISPDQMDDNEYQTALKNYPAAANEQVYMLNDVDKDVHNQLNEIFGESFMMVNLIQQNSQFVSGEHTAGNDVKLSEEGALDPLNQAAYEKFEQIPDSLVTQTVVKYVKDEYNAIGMDTDSMQIWYIVKSGLQMLIIALCSLSAVVLVTLLSSRVAAALGQELRSRMFKKVMSFSNNEMDAFSTASLITRTTNDVQQVQLLMAMLFRVVFYAPIIAIVGIFKVVSTQESMIWVIFIAVAAIFALVIILFSVAMPRFKKMQKLIDRLNMVARDVLTGMWVIRAFSTQKHEEDRFDDANQALTKTNLFVNRIMSCMMPAMMFIMNTVAVLVVWVGSHGVDDGTMQVGNMMAVIQYTMQIIMAFLYISMISVMLPRASVSARRIEEVLQTGTVINDPENPKRFTGSQKGYVEFKHVSFRYPNADENVLYDIDFVAKPGQTTAFIGSTGSGKSTLINLIPRFYDVTEGQILVDGIDVRDVTQHDLRARLGYVPQKGVLFSGDITSNIKYGKPQISDSQMVKAARIAQAEEFIQSKPNAYNDPIAQGGGNVSGGQKQRLSIARAISGNPEIYIFDDSFSALDYKTDFALRRALKSETSNSTVLIVAQRISTIMDADQILVLDSGKVVGKGTHKELLKNCEVYREIATSQLSEEELANE